MSFYGTTHVSGEATAVLGNDHSQRFHIDKSTEIRNTILLLQNAETFPAEIARALELLTSSQATERVDTPGRKRTREDTHEALERPLKRRNPYDQSCSSRKDGPSGRDRDEGHVLLSSSAEALFELTSNDSAGALGSISNGTNDFSQAQAIDTSLWTSFMRILRGKRHQAPLGVSTMVGLLLAVITSRHASPTELVKYFSNMHRDPLFPILSVVVGYWISTIVNRSISSPPSELKGDCVDFEDVFRGARKVPLSYFASVDILEGFFRSHYRGSSVEHLIESRQYSITVRRHDNKPLNLARTCGTLPLPSKSLVMAIRRHAAHARCLDCLNPIRQHSWRSKEYRCVYCRRPYGVLRVNTARSCPLNTSHFVQPPWRIRESSIWTRPGGVLNIDLDIPWRNHPHHHSCIYDQSDFRSEPGLVSWYDQRSISPKEIRAVAQCEDCGTIFEQNVYGWKKVSDGAVCLDPIYYRCSRCHFCASHKSIVHDHINTVHNWANVKRDLLSAGLSVPKKIPRSELMPRNKGTKAVQSTQLLNPKPSADRK